MAEEDNEEIEEKGDYCDTDNDCVREQFHRGVCENKRCKQKPTF